MIEVARSTVNNPFKPEIVDSTTISVRRKKPFFQASYTYDADWTKVSDEDAMQKVLDDLYEDTFKEKIQEKKILELELNFSKQKEMLEERLEGLSKQNDLITQSLFELTELLFSEEETEDEVVVEEENETTEEEAADESNESTDGN